MEPSKGKEAALLVLAASSVSVSRLPSAAEANSTEALVFHCGMGAHGTDNTAADAGECVEAAFCCPARVTDERWEGSYRSR